MDAVEHQLRRQRRNEQGIDTRIDQFFDLGTDRVPRDTENADERIAADLVVSDVPDQMAEFVADLDIADDGIGARLLADEIADLFDLVRIDHFADPDIEECALEQRTHVCTLIGEDHPDVV